MIPADVRRAALPLLLPSWLLLLFPQLLPWFPAQALQP